MSAPALNRWRRDLLGVAAWVALGFAAAVRGNWSEWVARSAQHYEAWQLDEWPLGLLLLAIGLCWFVWRRMNELQALLKQNQVLAQRLITVQEDERRALARELHDEFGQGCTAIRIEAQCVQGLGQGSAHQQAIEESARRIDSAAHALYSLVQDRLKQLRPQDLDGMGLWAAVQNLCENWELQTGVSCAFYPPSPLLQNQILAMHHDALQVAIYRIVQEALTNVARHAQASQVKVSAVVLGTSKQKALRLEIQDDGVGLSGPADGNQAGQAQGSTGFGLLGIQERAAALGGHMTLRSLRALRASRGAKDSGAGAPSGCCVQVTLPLKEGAA